MPHVSHPCPRLSVERRASASVSLRTRPVWRTYAQDAQRHLLFPKTLAFMTEKRASASTMAADTQETLAAKGRKLFSLLGGGSAEDRGADEGVGPPHPDPNPDPAAPD